MTSSEQISSAVERLFLGDIVAFPTETVYGLGASIRHDDALKKIFSVKERPFFDPLICHIHSLDQITELSNDWPEWAQVLSKKFWPGPLTIVVKKNPSLNSIITSGLDTVGIRMPRHPLAFDLLKAVNIPLAAPSANRFGRTSPTSAKHVSDEFPDKDILILNGDSSEIGIESTVVAWNSEKNTLMILRPGFITESQLKNALAGWKKDIRVLKQESKLSPGHTEFHYQPELPLVYIDGNPRALDENDFQKINEKLQICGRRFSILSLNEDPIIAARLLYEQMRQLSKQDIDFMVVFRKPEMQTELWNSIWNRLDKAAAFKLK